MPPISHRTLLNTSIIAGLIGQFMLSSNPRPAILICGVALAASLMDGWWYLQPLGKTWWYPALFGLLGLTMWDQPRGWFFMAWGAIEIGTGLRTQSLIRRLQQQQARALAEERERTERLAALGYEVESSVEAPPGEVVAPPPPPPPIPVWRYPFALAFGLIAAWLGAWGTRIFFNLTGWQLDLLAFGVGYAVGKAITIGAGDRSNTTLRVVSAVLSALGVVYGRYLLLSYLLFEKQNMEPQPGLIVRLAMAHPLEVLGVWMLIFVAAGAWAGWHFSADPWVKYHSWPASQRATPHGKEEPPA